VVFLSIFIAEMVLKMFAHGVIGAACGVDPFAHMEGLSDASSHTGIADADAAGADTHPRPVLNRASSHDASDVVEIHHEDDLDFEIPRMAQEAAKMGNPSAQTNPHNVPAETPAADAAPETSADGFIPGVSGSGANAVRLLRVLRPLRTFNRLKGLQVIIGALLGSLADLLQVVVLLIFFAAIFSIIGLQLWSGVLHRTCVPTDQVEQAMSLPRHEFFARDDTFSVDNFCTRSPAGTQCPANYTCLPAAANPGYGVFAFDDIGQSLFSVYVSMTFANWTALMMPLQDAYSRVTPGIYFVLLGLLLNFFASNLVLAVVVDNYSEHAEKARAELAMEQEEEDGDEDDSDDAGSDEDLQ